MKKFNLEILSPEGLIFKEKVEYASFPTISGTIGIFAGHLNLVSKLGNGEIIINLSNGLQKKISVVGGFIEISKNNVNIVAEFAIQSDEANNNKIDRAIDLAKEIKKKRKEFIVVSSVETQLKNSVSSLRSGISIKKNVR
ncbi:MAG: ATP synthase F1 subunit epsilon [Elusimicrobiota bacterium]|nr:ATP synthase F1 subunit epsilon [Elusimicrobiota bacterium]